MEKLTVKAGSQYDILIEKGLLKNCGSLIRAVADCPRIALVSDTNVYPIYGDKVKSALEAQGYEVFTYIFKAGESSKTPLNAVKIAEFFAEKGLTRSDAVAALGGGVCGDMAGFAAAAYMRGIKFIQIPTSLLSQVDSSVGGKTAVDLPQGKNLFGAFHQPSLVIIDPCVLDTLPQHFFNDGMGEVIKAGCIKSQELFCRFENENPRDFIEELIYECLDIKRAVVENDEKEHGERALLNFGHTCGHAIEKLWNFETISHGEAVGIGMVMEAQAGERLKITSRGTADRIAALLQRNNLKICDTHSVGEIVGAMKADKKRTNEGIKLIVLNNIGSSFVYPVKNDDIPAIFGV